MPERAKLGVGPAITVVRKNPRVALSSGPGMTPTELVSARTRIPVGPGSLPVPRTDLARCGRRRTTVDGRIGLWKNVPTVGAVSLIAPKNFLTVSIVSFSLQMLQARNSSLESLMAD